MDDRPLSLLFLQVPPARALDCFEEARTLTWALAASVVGGTANLLVLVESARVPEAVSRLAFRDAPVDVQLARVLPLGGLLRAHPDWEQYPLQSCFAEVRLARGAGGEARARILAMPPVKQAWRLLDGAGVLLRVACEAPGVLSRFLTRDLPDVPGVEAIVPHVALATRSPGARPPLVRARGIQDLLLRDAVLVTLLEQGASVLSGRGLAATELVELLAAAGRAPARPHLYETLKGLVARAWVRDAGEHPRRYQITPTGEARARALVDHPPAP